MYTMCAVRWPRVYHVRVSVVEDVAKWKGGYDPDAIRLEVVS
jgi:hypothetical protein